MKVDFEKTQDALCQNIQCSHQLNQKYEKTFYYLKIKLQI